MSTAMNEWLSKSGAVLDSNGEKITSKSYSVLVGIPYKTLTKYVIADPSKRREVGKAAGRNLILDALHRKVITDVLRRADRGNEDMDRREVIDKIQDMFPDHSLFRATCSRILTKPMLHHSDSKGLLKKSCGCVSHKNETVGNYI